MAHHPTNSVILDSRLEHSHAVEPAVADLVVVVESLDEMAHLAVDAVVEDVFRHSLGVEGLVHPDDRLEKRTSRCLGTFRTVPGEDAFDVVGDKPHVPEIVDAVVEIVVLSDGLLGQVPAPLEEVLAVRPGEILVGDVVEEHIPVLPVLPR